MNRFAYASAVVVSTIGAAMVCHGSALAGDCESTAACPQADVNCDNVADGFDIAVVRNTSNWLKPVGEADEPRADVNGDGVIDGFDIAAIRNTACWLRAGATRTQLAGNALTVYPYFEYVRAFNEDATVEIAIDPTRFPAISGKTCDIYVTEAKTAAEWAADPALLDASAGGVRTATFLGATIQENTHTLTEPFELSADAGLGLGVGYDVVLDCDRHGELGGGDFIDGMDYVDGMNDVDGLVEEAGLYAVHDLTLPGPLAATVVDYSGGAWLGQRTWYPVNIASMGEVPLIMISHGHGHQHFWYDYLQEHLASYGYIVMSHENNTAGGLDGAAMSTLTNTDYFLANLATIAGGIFEGHVDSGHIVWIGHSRGGEGIAQAYDLLWDGTYTAEFFTMDDIALISPIAPPDVTGAGRNDPHDANYHLLYGSADGDVWGCAASQHQPFRQLERATGYKSSTLVHGADHNDFNCCGWDNFWGPAETEIGREEAQRVAKAVYLAVIKRYVEDNIPAKDLLWRQWESFKPMGVAESTIVVSEYKDGPEAGNFIIDDYQTQPSPSISSSGGAVTYNVLNLTEARMQDGNSTFTWMPSDPMNGMTRAGSADTARGVVFDWSADPARFYEYAIIPSARDFSTYAYLSFHACQGTRHPSTLAELGDLTFTVTLRDAAGSTSSINIGAFGGGIEETYLREGCGDGAGWMNEFETIRIRLSDFMTNGSALDISEIMAVRLEFGSSFGSEVGRIGIDDIELTQD